MTDFEDMLRKSLEVRKTKPLEAVNDLNAIVTDLATAVSSVTRGRLKCFLDPLKPKPNQGPTYALVLRFAEEDRALRVIVLSDLGYPVTIWANYAVWDKQSGIGAFGNVENASQLRAHLHALVNGPQSELVRLIANELAVAEADSEAALAQ